MILMEAGGEYGKHHRQAEFGMFMGPNGRVRFVMSLFSRRPGPLPPRALLRYTPD